MGQLFCISFTYGTVICYVTLRYVVTLRYYVTLLHYVSALRYYDTLLRYVIRYDATLLRHMMALLNLVHSNEQKHITNITKHIEHQ